MRLFSILRSAESTVSSPSQENEHTLFQNGTIKMIRREVAFLASLHQHLGGRNTLLSVDIYPSIASVPPCDEDSDVEPSACFKLSARITLGNEIKQYIINQWEIPETQDMEERKQIQFLKRFISLYYCCGHNYYEYAYDFPIWDESVGDIASYLASEFAERYDAEVNFQQETGALKLKFNDLQVASNLV